MEHKNLIRNHQLQSYISPRLWDTLNNLYEPGETLDAYLTNDYKTRDHLETPEDLQDIIKLNRDILDSKKDMTFDKAKRIIEFIKYSEGIILPQNMGNLDTIHEFKTEYPDLFDTIMTWAYE